MRGNEVVKQNTFVQVENLRAADIGKTIRLRVWDAAKGVETVVTAELMLVIAFKDRVRLGYGANDPQEIVLPYGSVIHVEPVDGDYSQVEALPQVEAVEA